MAKKAKLTEQFAQNQRQEPAIPCRGWEVKIGEGSLTFSIRTDIDRDAKDFLECLDAAAKIIKKEIIKKIK